MHFAIVSDAFYPDRNSASVHLRDLSLELIRCGHQVTVFVPSPFQKKSLVTESLDDIFVVRIRTFKTRDTTYVVRVLGEFIMPFLMIFQYRLNQHIHDQLDGVIWYSPSIFHGPFVNLLKKKYSCRSYLIIRDIFPEWAVDVGLMRKNLPYLFFSAIAKYQYSVADVIGIQTFGNSYYFEKWRRGPRRKLEVLPSWYGHITKIPCSIRISQTILAGRKVFVYAGNMGVAQGMSILIDLAKELEFRQDVGFLFVGRGSDMINLQMIAQKRELKNTLFFDEINPDEIPELYAQCKAGIVALDPRHKSHNIPGKFISYMQNGLPVLANINPGNDLADLIREHRVGKVCEDNNLLVLKNMAELLLEEVDADVNISNRCKLLFNKHFAAESAAKQIIAALSVR